MELDDPIEYEVIGQGQEGRVIKYFDVDEEKYLVIKQIKRQDAILKFRNRKILLTVEEIEKIYNEEVSYLQYLNSLHSNYFPHYYKSYMTDKYFNIVMEYIKGVMLSKKISEVMIQNTCLRAEYGWQMYDIFLILAENNLVYFDLNRDNFIVTSANDVKLIDFGLTCSDKTSLVCGNELSMKIFGKC